MSLLSPTGRTTSTVGLLAHARAVWATERVLSRARNSRERQNLRYQARVDEERRFGDVLNKFAPRANSVLCVGAGFR